ncbi:lipid IV(A) 3-deoxy-D-manno-octulosonic acid transferase [Photobacterium sp. SDRW27]|uniref:lipid IV(A) 3-deoxy-D-manno-octulosonic acid transferase n=1 Tax=Photobacterium obscurum TaxID=2829490 RepID=UPI00224385E3|nr:lipid IV(A) 3-deoxy-D-manno-octulosonic acid transferase [Photobacterium obscurum]MCW8329584.1 lipid IV(A) 3-deoxy-D-manno-octulosonic acid transferase [Photobacterium obscurum]
MIYRIVYSLLLYLLAPLLLVRLYKPQPGKPSVGKRWPEHFGFTPPLSVKHPIWVHAVSVGETIAVTPLLKQLKAAHPNTPILVTTTTPTGAEQAAKLGDLVEHRYMPLDFSWAVRRFIKVIRPRALYIMETELWPNTLAIAKQSGVSTTVINARLSERSCQRYAKFQPIFDLLAKNIDSILCQHQDDATRFERLGIAEDKIQVTGSIKFDITPATGLSAAASALRQQLGNSRPVWIAASTHSGEDEQVLQAHSALLASHPTALLILVPRHPERFNSVFSLCQQQGLNVIRRTSNDTVQNNTQVYLADTMGEMMLLLGCSDIAFVGGSLIGDKVGGHNLLEPASLSLPTLTGPSFFNFMDITRQLLEANGAAVVDDSQQLTQQLCSLFNDPEQRKSMGLAAFSVVKCNQGAIRRTITALNSQQT